MGNSGSKTLTVNLNWFNFDLKKEKYTLVKESQGGWKRCSKIEKCAILEDVFEQMRNKFFPNGKNNTKGNLRNFHVEFCTSTFEAVENLESTISAYKERHFLKELKFTLRTKQKARFEILKEKVYEKNFDKNGDSDSYEDFETPKKRKVSF